jgi:hypothetical protein
LVGSVTPPMPSIPTTVSSIPTTIPTTIPTIPGLQVPLTAPSPQTTNPWSSMQRDFSYFLLVRSLIHQLSSFSVCMSCLFCYLGDPG